MYLNIFKIEREKSQKTFNRKKWKIYLKRKRKRKRKKGLSPLLSRWTVKVAGQTPTFLSIVVNLLVFLTQTLHIY